MSVLLFLFGADIFLAALLVVVASAMMKAWSGDAPRSHSRSD
jgi:hypothetical protein